jgi:hypothetical protein
MSSGSYDKTPHALSLVFSYLTDRLYQLSTILSRFIETKVQKYVEKMLRKQDMLGGSYKTTPVWGLHTFLNLGSDLSRLRWRFHYYTLYTLCQSDQCAIGLLFRTWINRFFAHFLGTIHSLDLRISSACRSSMIGRRRMARRPCMAFTKKLPRNTEELV